MKIGDILWRAVTSPLGIEVMVSDIEAFKRKFYSTRIAAREAGNFEFDQLQLISPPPGTDPGKLWITKKGETDDTNKTYREKAGETIQENLEAF